jgi:prolyl oligopeptidase
VRVETKAGHGAGTATDKRLSQMADLFTFVLKALDVRLPEQ